MRNIQDLALAAREHAHNVANDINNTSTRVEYIRLTQLAIEADNIASDLERIADDSSNI
jgi:hypothetical protein